ncbi:MAG: ureidoglycolate lyase [Elainellaceae cyanobacterium]
MPETIQTITIIAQPITPESFAPFGQVISPSDDGKLYDATDAQLVLDQGTPRFYIMRLTGRGRRFFQITRHRRCTQCLGSLGGKEWLLGVAPPGPATAPDKAAIQAFQIPGTCFVKLHVGTWHAGPYFDAEVVDFYNLELSDTNVVDHDTCDLKQRYGIAFEITGPGSLTQALS